MDEAARAPLAHLYEEGRTNVRSQIEIGTDLDTKASQVFRFNTLVIGVLVSAISIIVRFDGPPLRTRDWVLHAMVGGVVLLGLSAALAILASMVTEFATGLRAEDLAQAHGASLQEGELLEEMVTAYTRAEAVNRDNLDKTARRLKGALWLLFAGIALLGTSAVTLIYDMGAL